MGFTRLAVVITHNRPELLKLCVAAAARQVDAIVVMDNASDPPVRSLDFKDVLDEARRDGFECRMLVSYDPTQPPVLPQLWTVGLGLARALYMGSSDLRRGEPSGQDYHVAMLCDDVILPVGWFSAVRAAMLQTGATAGAVDPFGRRDYFDIKSEPDGDIMGRMPGHAFMLNATAPVPDPSMHWWWCDTDMDFQARKMGGMVMIGTAAPAINQKPNDWTNQKPELAERAGRDAEAFVAKWGYRPW